MNRLHGMWSLGTVVGGGIASLMAAANVGLQVHLVGAGVVLLLAAVWVIPGLRIDHDTPPQTTVNNGSSALGLVVLFAILGGAAITAAANAVCWSPLSIRVPIATPRKSSCKPWNQNCCEFESEPPPA